MKSYLTWYGHKPFNQNSHSEQERSFGAKLRDTWHMLLSWLAASAEPHVWSTRDRTGHVSWSAYDPQTNQRLDHLSAADMRVWLEERHYQDQAIAQRQLQQFKISHLN
ncbi:MAG: hypothetical protein Kow00121_58550 [Elainellaceae cyanobacterium]